MILGELLGLKVIVALNKTDMIKENKEERIKSKIDCRKKPLTFSLEEDILED